MVKFQSSGFLSVLLWTFSTADQGGRLLEGWNQVATRVSNRFQCDNLCRQLKSCRLAVYSYQERTCLVKHSTERVTPDAQDLYSVAAAARSICRECADDETCIPVTEARTSLCISTDSLQGTVSSKTVTVSMSNPTTTSPASSVATLDITTLCPSSSTPGTTAASLAAPTTSSSTAGTTSETSPPSTLTPRVPTSISTRLEAVTPETPPTSTSTTAVPTSISTRPEAVTPETPPTSTATTAVPTSISTRLEAVISESSTASSTTGTTSTPLPTTDTSTSAMPTTTPEPCPPGAAHLTSESVCVRMFNGIRRWNSTEAVCKSESFNSNTYRMITFKTKEKYDEIIAYLTQKNTSAVGIWVGLIHTSGAWRWEDGSEAQYLPWDPTEPNSNSEKCGVIYKPTHWTLHNNHCNRLWSAMCEVSAR